MKLRILGINCAYTKVGPVAQMLAESLEACGQWAKEVDGMETTVETVHLADVMRGFTTPVQGLILEHMKEAAKKLLAADVVLFATPVFWGMPSPLFMQFLVDITPYEFDGDFPLRGKVAGVIAHCDEDGCGQVVNAVLGPLRHFGFATPPHGDFWRNRTGARFSEGKWQENDHTHVLAPNLVEMALAFKKSPPEWR